MTEELVQQAEARAMRAWQQHVERRARRRPYPLNLPFHLLTHAQQAERLDTAEDVKALLFQAMAGERFRPSQTNRMNELMLQRRFTHGKHPISPAQWDLIDEIRAQLYPE